MSTFTVSFSAYDRVSKNNLYFKADGKRFNSQRTIKICCDVKYDVSVAVRPSVSRLQKLVIGGDDITPDSVEEKAEYSNYNFTWFTNGYTQTAKGQRHELHFSFLFENSELVTNFQVKFYPIQSTAHLTWGTEINRIELMSKGKFGSGATAFQTLSPTDITFR